MKKMFLTMAVTTALVFSQVANGQITLEKTFDGQVGYSGTYISTYQDYYTYVNAETNQIRLYNEDYSLYKTITVVPPTGLSIGSASLFSKNIITTDNKVTFFVLFTASTMPTDRNLYSTLRLYNEDNAIVKDFGYSYLFGTSYHAVSNECRLSILRYVYTDKITYATDIYSLPGTVTDLRSAQVEKTKQFPYPNPANTVIVLPYKLEQGETAVMNIYNMNGQLVDVKQIDFVFDRILLNVSGYAKGVYIYEVKGVSNRFIVE